jgi:DNA-3-methyladenine glycosylase I
VIIGHDGKLRCAWAGSGDTAFSRYHDEVWGTCTYDEPAMFEALTLGVFQVGLSWSIVFGKRDAFRKAFRGFDVAKVAAMTEREIDQLVQPRFTESTQHRLLGARVGDRSAFRREFSSRGSCGVCC